MQELLMCVDITVHYCSAQIQHRTVLTSCLLSSRQLSFVRCCRQNDSFGIEVTGVQLGRCAELPCSSELSVQCILANFMLGYCGIWPLKCFFCNSHLYDMFNNLAFT